MYVVFYTNLLKTFENKGPCCLIDVNTNIKTSDQIFCIDENVCSTIKKAFHHA